MSQRREEMVITPDDVETINVEELNLGESAIETEVVESEEGEVMFDPNAVVSDEQALETLAASEADAETEAAQDVDGNVSVELEITDAPPPPPLPESAQERYDRLHGDKDFAGRHPGDEGFGERKPGEETGDAEE